MTTQTERITLSLCDKHQIAGIPIIEDSCAGSDFYFIAKADKHQIGVEEMPSRDCDYPALDEGLDGISIAILLCIGGAGAILMLIGAYTVVRCIIGLYTVGRWIL